MPPTLPLAQRPPPPQPSHNCFRCLSDFRLSALSVSLSVPLPTRSMAKPFGTQSNCLICSWITRRPGPLDLEYVIRLNCFCPGLFLTTFRKVWYIAFAFIIAQVRAIVLLPSSEALTYLTARARTSSLCLILKDPAHRYVQHEHFRKLHQRRM